MMRTILAVLILVIYLIITIPVVLVLRVIRKKHPEVSARVAFAMNRRFLSFELFICGTKVERHGLGNIPDEPALYVGNHRSYFDILITYTCMRIPTGYVAKDSMAKIPLMAQWMDLMNCVFMNRTNIKEGLKAILKTSDNIKNGSSMYIFPEGTRNKGDNMDVPGEFKEGSLKAAQKAGCRIVPVAVRNTEQVLEAHFPWVKSTRVSVTFLKPYCLGEIPAEYRKTPARYTRMLIEEELAKR